MDNVFYTLTLGKNFAFVILDGQVTNAQFHPIAVVHRIHFVLVLFTIDRLVFVHYTNLGRDVFYHLFVNRMCASVKKKSVFPMTAMPIAPNVSIGSNS